MPIPRRSFLATLPAGWMAAGAGAFSQVNDGDDVEPPGAPHQSFPAQDPRLVRQVVGASHRDIDTVRELVTARPALAKASWDWGFGDWESALGAASHTGRREITELLIAHGARPNLFTFAMLDQVEVVRAVIEANPGVQRVHGPHGITLLAHARAGDAQRVIEYLQTIDGADDPQPQVPLDEAQRAACLGTFRYGGGADGVLTVGAMRSGALAIRRGDDDVQRRLLHLGDHVFSPAGAPAVRISFRIGAGGVAEGLTVHDGDLIVSAGRVTTGIAN